MYGKSKMQFHEFTSSNELNLELARQIHNILVDAVAERGQAFLVISGGKTPIDLFKCLAKTNLPWEKVTVCLADERCVDIEATDRNEALVKKYLLQDHAKNAKWISLYDEQNRDNLTSIEKTFSALPTFDAVILGMGEDGHTASLFPCSQELSNGLASNAPSVLFVIPKNAPFKRVSLSKTRLMNTHHLFLHLVGAKKHQVFNQAMAGENSFEMPIRAFIHQQQLPLQVMYAPS
jgi:6-phosphogluconolactonase